MIFTISKISKGLLAYVFFSACAKWQFFSGQMIDFNVKTKYLIKVQKDLSQFQWKSAHALKKELPKDFL